jgi:hypothetical protein
MSFRGVFPTMTTVEGPAEAGWASHDHTRLMEKKGV